jgi:hypothetical protein
LAGAQLDLWAVGAQALRKIQTQQTKASLTAGADKKPGPLIDVASIRKLSLKYIPAKKLGHAYYSKGQQEEIRRYSL